MDRKPEAVSLRVPLSTRELAKRLALAEGRLVWGVVDRALVMYAKKIAPQVLPKEPA